MPVNICTPKISMGCRQRIRPTSPTSSIASTITRSTGSMSFCRGTGRPCQRRRPSPKPPDAARRFKPSGYGLQARSGRGQDLAPPEGDEPVVFGHRRRHIHRWCRRKRHRNLRRLTRQCHPKSRIAVRCPLHALRLAIRPLAATGSASIASLDDAA
mgnify:CR=1 FL=1